MSRLNPEFPRFTVLLLPADPERMVIDMSLENWEWWRGLGAPRGGGLATVRASSLAWFNGQPDVWTHLLALDASGALTRGLCFAGFGDERPTFYLGTMVDEMRKTVSLYKDQLATGR